MLRLSGGLRRLLLAPPLASVTFAGRGFGPDEAANPGLDAVPQAVVLGFEIGIEARQLREVEWRAGMVTEELRGFVYEGVTMAYTILDRLVPGRRDRTRELMSGPAARHVFLTYIGLGFAMARLPRARWRGVLPDLAGSAYYPDLSWLAVDGYGFDLAYFHPERWVAGQRRPAPYPWLGEPDYFPRAVDQGIGRALWFIHAGRPGQVAAAVARFPPERRPDLWSGVGLAATFAGGADHAGLRQLVAAAAEHRPELAQGAAFAAKARQYAGPIPTHTAAAAVALTGLPAAAAARVVDAAVASVPAGSPLAYERWRARTRQRFARIEDAIWRVASSE